MGRLIVFEGIDGSGKSTQFKMLCRRLEAEGRAFLRLVFPSTSLHRAASNVPYR